MTPQQATEYIESIKSDNHMFRTLISNLELIAIVYHGYAHVDQFDRLTHLFQSYDCDWTSKYKGIMEVCTFIMNTTHHDIYANTISEMNVDIVITKYASYVLAHNKYYTSPIVNEYGTRMVTTNNFPHQ